MNSRSFIFEQSFKLVYVLSTFSAIKSKFKSTYLIHETRKKKTKNCISKDTYSHACLKAKPDARSFPRQLNGGYGFRRSVFCVSFEAAKATPPANPSFRTFTISLSRASRPILAAALIVSMSSPTCSEPLTTVSTYGLPLGCCGPGHAGLLFFSLQTHCRVELRRAPISKRIGHGRWP